MNPKAGSSEPSTDRDHALARFLTIRSQTETLADPLSPEDQTAQSMSNCSPTKWHRAHTTWFFEEFLLDPQQPDYQRVHPDFQYHFNSYYEAVGPRQPRPQRGLITRPSVEEIGRYRTTVNERVSDFLSSQPDELPRHIADIVELGANHEQQHQELLLMDIKHLLSHNSTNPRYADPPVATDAGATVDGPSDGTGNESGDAELPTTWSTHAGGLVQVGYDGVGFCFDNETPGHQVWLEPFQICDRLVTAGQWLEFMADDGYKRAELWLSDGWAWVNQTEAQAPLYWQEANEGWHQFTLHGLQPVDPAAPVVHVNYYEADAFARWADARLPTESEWEVATTDAVPDDTARPFALHPIAADPDQVGIQQLFRAVWQWTSSAYSPYPGFQPAAGAVGEYNGKFMVDQQVLRGGACITPVGHSRPTYRNFYQAASQWPFTGLRLARNA